MNHDKTLILDLDGTVTTHSTWVALNTAMGVTPEQDDELFQQYVNGKLPYIDWIKKLIEIYQNNHSSLTKQQLVQLADDIELHTDAVDFVQSAKARGYRVILVSGSVDVLVERVAERISADSWLACSKAIFEGDTFLNLVSMGDEGTAKIKLVRDFGIELSENTISVGDGGNEKELFELTTGILIGNNKTLLPLAWKQVNNLTEATDVLP
jgi:HAD superfamily phosphoserine phosphatase-like hydrolase